MNSVGEIVQEAIEMMDRGSREAAMRPITLAVQATAGKALATDEVRELDISAFVRANWTMLSFMGLTQALPLPLKIPFALKRIVPTFNSLHGAEEIVALVINQTLQFGQLQPHFSFNSTGEFEAKGGRMLLPNGLPTALLGTVIFHPINSDETIGEKYWFNFGDFRMFVSELFGRQDLAERIIKFYQDRD